jgi:flagellar protein FlbD
MPSRQVLILLSRGSFLSWWLIMILLTRLNGQAFILNADKIRYVEQTPDTVVCCDTGEKMMVKETLAEVTRRAIEYARVIRRPITD